MSAGAGRAAPPRSPVPREQIVPSVPTLRIALVTHYFESHRGGVESVAGQLAARLGATGAFSIEWVSSDVTPPPSEVPGVTGVAVRAWNGLERRGFPWPVWGPRGLSRLRRAIAGADIVHIHDFIYFPNIAAFVFARLAQKPVVITQHIGQVPFPNPLLSTTVRLLNRSIGRWMLGGADQVVFVSDAVRRYFAAFVRFRREAMHVANGVNTGMFSLVDAATRQHIRRSLGVAAADRVVLYVGRFVDKKGVPLLGTLARALPQYQWWFAGWGAAVSSAHPATWQLPRVRVFGDRSAATLAELYVGADLLVLASLSEGFPLVVQEAFACGTPVLVAERIADGAPAARGYLRMASIDGDDVVDTWTAAIARTLDENEDRARSESLAQFARNEWSWPATVARYESIFRSVVR